MIRVINTYVKHALNPNFVRYIYSHINSVVCGLLNDTFGNSDYAALSQ